MKRNVRTLGCSILATLTLLVTPRSDPARADAVEVHLVGVADLLGGERERRRGERGRELDAEAVPRDAVPLELRPSGSVRLPRGRDAHRHEAEAVGTRHAVRRIAERDLP